jgi:hypothetical protein
VLVALGNFARARSACRGAAPGPQAPSVATVGAVWRAHAELQVLAAMGVHGSARSGRVEPAAGPGVHAVYLITAACAVPVSG